MKCFKDDNGQQWDLKIDWDMQEKLFERHQVDILQLDQKEGEALVALLDAPAKLTRILFCICEYQATARGVSESDFRNAIKSDGLTRAVDAFAQEAASFFSTTRQKQFLKFWAATLRVGQLVETQAEKQLALMPEVDQLAFEVLAKEVPTENRTELAEALGIELPGLSTTSPVDSELTPESTPTANSSECTSLETEIVGTTQPH